MDVVPPHFNDATKEYSYLEAVPHSTLDLEPIQERGATGMIKKSPSMKDSSLDLERGDDGILVECLGRSSQAL